MSAGAPRRILVLGGTGFVGRAVCARLLQALGPATQITVPSRRPVRAPSLRMQPGLVLPQADVHLPASLDALLQGQDLVINLVAVLQGNAARFQHVHVDLPAKLAAACMRTGVRRVVHVSALGVSADAPSMYLRSKAAGEAVLQAAGLDLTLLRPSVIFGAGDSFLKLFARLQALAPVLPLAGAQALFQPVWVEDVAAAIVHCCLAPRTAGQIYELAGPRAAPLSHWVALAGRLAGVERRQIALPAALARLQALMLELLPGEPLMSRDNLASMQVPNVATGRLPGLAALGITPRSVEAVVPDYLSPRG